MKNGDQNGDTVVKFLFGVFLCKESNYEVDTSCCLACHVSWHNRLTDEAPFCADGIMYGELQSKETEVHKLASVQPGQLQTCCCTEK